MALHIPWDRKLGGAQVQMALADELAQMGHVVEHFALDDAFPRLASSRLSPIARMLFPLSLRRHVRRRTYDVIDALEAAIPAGRTDGTALVVRSIGLIAMYEEFERWARTRWPDEPRGTHLGRIMRGMERIWFRRASRRSLARADVVLALNEEEEAWLREDPSVRGIRRVAPAIAPDRLAQLAALDPFRARPQPALVVFIGYWSPRKGARDFVDIVRRVWATRPETRFRFVATGKTDAEVRATLGAEADTRIEVHPDPERSEFAALLADATLGVFPSYIEGFGIAVLEMLAAGVPVVAYDVPGPREPLSRVCAPDLLSPVGDPAAVADRLIGLLADGAGFGELAARCAAVGGEYRWRSAAHEVVATYEEARRRL